MWLSFAILACAAPLEHVFDLKEGAVASHLTAWQAAGQGLVPSPS